MDISKSLMKPDIDNIVSEAAAYKYKGIKLTLHTVDSDIDDFSIVSLDIVRDYVNKIADQIYVKISVSAGTYVHSVYPYISNMEATIEKTNYESNNGKPIIKRYKVVVSQETNDELNPDKLTEFNEIELNRTSLTIITLQCIDRSVEAMSVKRTGGVFRDTTRADILRSVLSTEMQRIRVDGVKVLDSIDVDKPNNESKVSQIVIPTHTKVIGLPKLLQDDENGIYSSGIGIYFQRYSAKNTCFVYPLYNPLRFITNRPRLIVFLLQDPRMSNIDTTYTVDGFITSIIATVIKEDTYSTNVKSRNVPLGFSKLNPDRLLNDPIVKSPNGPKGAPTDLEDDVVFAKRTDQLDDVIRPGDHVNTLTQMSEVALNVSKRVDIQWNYSDETLLYPGMPIRIFRQVGNTIKQVDGTVLFNHTLYGSESEGLANRSFRAVTHITAAVKGEYYE